MYWKARYIVWPRNVATRISNVGFSFSVKQFLFVMTALRWYKTFQCNITTNSIMTNWIVSTLNHNKMREKNVVSSNTIKISLHTKWTIMACIFGTHYLLNTKDYFLNYKYFKYDKYSSKTFVLLICLKICLIHYL